MLVFRKVLRTYKMSDPLKSQKVSNCTKISLLVLGEFKGCVR